MKIFFSSLLLIILFFIPIKSEASDEIKERLINGKDYLIAENYDYYTYNAFGDKINMENGDTMNFILKQARFCELVFSEDMLVTIDFKLLGEFGKCDFIGIDWSKKSLVVDPIIYSIYDSELYEGSTLNTVDSSFMVYGNENNYASGRAIVKMLKGYNYILFNDGFTERYNNGEMTVTIRYSPLPKSPPNTGANNINYILGIVLLSTMIVVIKLKNRT